MNFAEEAVEFLRAELKRRVAQNKRYSLRALARDAGLSPSFLAEIFRGKNTLSAEKALAVGDKLGWSKSKTRIFAAYFRVVGAKNDEALTLALKELKVLQAEGTTPCELADDEFACIAEWYHFAIIELVATHNFEGDLQDMADRLGLTIDEAEMAVYRLERLGLIERDEGRFKRKHDFYNVDGKNLSDAVQKFHVQHLDHAKSAIVQQPPGARFFRGTTMAIDPKNLPAVRDLLQRFNKELMLLLESGEKTAVYHFSTQLFRLDKVGAE